MKQVSFAVAAVLVLYVATVVWIARHPGAVRDAAVISRVRAWTRQHLKAEISALSRRLSIDEAAVIALIVGFVVVVALAVGFTEVLEDVLEGEGVAVVDQPASSWLATHRDPWLTTALRVITVAGSVVALGVLAAVVSVLVAWQRRSWLPLVLGVVGAGGIGLIIMTAKELVGRERPSPGFAVIVEHGYSFPSGHATGSAAIVLLCAWMLTRSMITSWVGRVTLWAIAIGFVGAIGFSRVYLGVHYVSDVLAGWLLGAAWAVAVILVGSWWADARREATTAWT